MEWTQLLGYAITGLIAFGGSWVTINKTVSVLSTQVSALQKDVDDLSNKFDELLARLGTVDKDLARLEERVNVMEREIKELKSAK